MTQVSTKLLIPFFCFISDRQRPCDAADDGNVDDAVAIDDDVNTLSSCIADALFPRYTAVLF